MGDLTSSNDPLTLLIASSGDAETNAVQSAVDAWSAQSGVKATVQVASDLSQQLAQGFAAGSPPGPVLHGSRRHWGLRGQWLDQGVR